MIRNPIEIEVFFPPMLWLPTKQTRKAIARAKRLRRRRRIARCLLFLFVLFGLTTAAAPSSQALLVQVNNITTVHQFDFVDWMSTAIVAEIGRRVSSPALPPSESEQRALVHQYLDHEQKIREIKSELNQLYAAGSDTAEQVALLEQALADEQRAQGQIKPQVERILSQQVETILREEAFTVFGNQVFPPVAFRLVEPPTNLVISPRDKIINQHSVQLETGLDTSTRFALEEAIDRRGDVSSYITNVGGLGSYPTMVLKSPNFIWLVEVIAHEWAHNYFLTFPANLGWGYQTYPKLTTINETAADIIGQEVGRKVITRFYPEWADQLPPLDDDNQLAPAQPSEFHLAMRDIRREVDRLLAEGNIEAAEAFMETERQKLVEKGYTLRKLNQAYFAFHGSYALSPGSVDPIGPQMRQLRAKSPSLKEFANRVAWLNSYNDYLQWLAEADIE